MTVLTILVFGFLGLMNFQENPTATAGDLGCQGEEYPKHMRRCDNICVARLREPSTPQTVLQDESWTHPTPNVQRWHDLAIQVGWSENNWRWLSCVINRESRGNPTAHNSKDPGKGSFGLTQINSANLKFLRTKKVLWSIAELKNPEINLKSALTLFNEVGKGPWKSKKNPCGS